VPDVFGHYENFFIASSGASAAILGLLFVAVTVANADDADRKTRERRTVLAGSAFLALIDAFFVSILALTGGAGVFGMASLLMGLVGLLGTSRLIPRAWRAGNFSRGFPTRRLNIVFASISAGGFQSSLASARLYWPTIAVLRCNALWCSSSWACTEARWDGRGRSWESVGGAMA